MMKGNNFGLAGFFNEVLGSEIGSSNLALFDIGELFAGDDITFVEF